MNSLGSTCTPKRSRLETHSIVVYVNSTPYCTSIELEHHRGPCRCECSLNPSSCQGRQQFLPDSCSCQCLPSLASEKSICNNSSVHRWDSDTCQNTCKHNQNHLCQSGYHFNTNRYEHAFHPYPLLEIIMAVILSVVTRDTRWRNNSHHNRQLESKSKAYTITLCSDQNLDKAN